MILIRWKRRSKWFWLRLTRYKAIRQKLSFQEMIRVKKWIMDKKNHEDSNCLLTTVIAHGNQMGRLASVGGDGGWVVEDFITELDEVETLTGKPKMLILQSCRGRMFNFVFCISSKIRTLRNISLYKLDQVNSKSFVGKDFLWIKWKFELQFIFSFKFC